MGYDETTTEIPLPSKTTESNIVRVDFKSSAVRKSQAIPLPPSPHKSNLEWFHDLDLGTPWILRLVAVVMILILSLLIV